MEVVVRDGGIEGAILLLKKQILKDGIHKGIKRREAYIKPSERKRAKEREAASRRRRTQRRRERQMER